MPMYRIECECGSNEGFASLKQWEEHGRSAECVDCGEWSATKIVPVALVGVWDSRPLEIKQIGRTFHSQKELNDYCAKEGVEVVSNSDRKWRNVVDAAHDAADASRKKQGYSSKEEKSRRWKKDYVDQTMAAREREIKAYHDQYGGRPEANAADKGYGNGKVKN